MENRLSLRRQNSIRVLEHRTSATTFEEMDCHVYDGVQCIADIDGQGDVVASYTWGAGIDNLLAVKVSGAFF